MYFGISITSLIEETANRKKLSKDWPWLFDGPVGLMVMFAQ